jgi:uncharacterized membrane protein
MTMPETTSAGRRSVPIILGAIGAFLVAAVLLMWAHYGTVVFLEMIRAGIAACFG